MLLDPIELPILRRAFAAQVCRVAGTTDPALQDAFETVERERFLGPPPWTFGRSDGVPGTVVVDDPVHVYQDVLFLLKPLKAINNGRPSLHAVMLHALAVRDTDRVCHLGAGTGYYSAIMSVLAGSGGEVTAVEFDPDLAAQAERNLEHHANCKVVFADARAYPVSEVDCIYVNFAVNTIPENWIDHLAPGGRLIVPLGILREQPGSRVRGAVRAAVMRITKLSVGFAAQFVCPSFFVGDSAGVDREVEKIDLSGADKVRSLDWKISNHSDAVWYRDNKYALSYRDPIEK